MKQLQISRELFLKLCRYHLLEDYSEDLRCDICAGLEEKLDRAAARERYAERFKKHNT